MSSTTPHHCFIDNDVEYISLEDAVEVINTNNNQIRWLREKVSTLIKLVEEKDDYINKLEEKTTNWVINLKETIKEKDQRIKELTPEEKGNRLHEEYLTLTPEQQENWDLHGPNKPWEY